MKKAILISCFNWYKSRLKPIREILVDKGYEVIVLVSDFDHISKKPVKHIYNECNYIHVPEYRKNISIQRIKSHMKFGKEVNKYLFQFSPDLIYVQIPPNNVARYCTAYKKRYSKCKLFLDIIDMWPESLPINRIKNMPFIRVWKNWRTDCILNANHVFTECNLYQERLTGVIDLEKTSTLYLYKEQTEEEKLLIREIINNKKTEDKKIKFAYLGSINNIIDIESICCIIKEFESKGYQTEIHIIGAGENEIRFQNQIKTTGCKVYFYGAIYDELEKIRILAACDFAFNMMRDTSEVGLTIKSIDYFSYGLPIINNIKGDTWKLIEKEQIGINVGKDNNIDFDMPNFQFHNETHKKICTFFERTFSKELFIENFKLGTEVDV